MHSVIKAGGLPQCCHYLAQLRLAALRLLPAIQKIYMAWTTVISSRDILSDVLAMLDQRILKWRSTGPTTPEVSGKKFVLTRVMFRYTEDGPWF